MTADAKGTWPDLAATLQEPLGRKLGAGDLGVVMARAGVGKTAFLVQLALGEALSGNDVVHIGLGRSIEQVQAHYDALFNEGASRLTPSDRESLRVEWIRRRAVRVFSDGRFSPERLQETLDTFSRHLHLAPTLILVDGNDWQAIGPDDLSAYKQVAGEAGAALWFLARVKGEVAEGLPPPVGSVADRVDLAVLLEPDRAGVRARPLWTFGARPSSECDLLLQPGTLRLPDSTRSIAAGRLLAAACTLLSGAAKGAEAEFGACAERHGVDERNFTFAGRSVARSRGLVILGDEELRQGDVSWAYLSSRLGRQFAPADRFRKIFQSIWHQVNPAGEVFTVGALQPDGTVRGGTGWAVELARHLNKKAWVFDQKLERWFLWEGGGWEPREPPVITEARFAGSGTQSLNPAGRQAIRGLFDRTFSD